MVYGTKISLERKLYNLGDSRDSILFPMFIFIKLTEETISQHIEEGFSMVTKSFEELVLKDSGENSKEHIIHNLILQSSTLSL